MMAEKKGGGPQSMMRPLGINCFNSQNQNIYVNEFQIASGTKIFHDTFLFGFIIIKDIIKIYRLLRKIQFDIDIAFYQKIVFALLRSTKRSHSFAKYQRPLFCLRHLPKMYLI